MFSKKELSPVERKKQRIIARCDRLRAECGQIMGAVGQRAEIAEEAGLGRLPWLRPALSFASVMGLSLMRQRAGGHRGVRYLGPLLSAATVAMDISRRTSAREQSEILRGRGVN